MERFSNCFDESASGTTDLDHDILEVCGFGGSKRRADPPNVESDTFKPHFFEFYGLGEVEKTRRYQ
jgi:hypothetical protein